MFEQLMQIIQSQATETVINNPEVPNEHNDAVIKEAGQSVTSSLQNMLASGNVRDVMGLFNSAPDQLNSQPAMQQISGSFISSLTEKFGLNTQQAGSVAGSLLPSVLGQLINKTNDPNDKSLNIQDIFNQLSNGKTSGLDIGGMFSKFKGGLDKDGDGDVDFSDLTSMFSSGGNSGGGLMDKLKGMLGS